MRTLRSWFFFGSLVSLGLVAAVACTSEEKSNNPLDVSNDDGGKKRDSGGTSSSGGTDNDGGDSILEGGTGSGRVYAHTQDTLYLFDPTTKKLTTIGKFDCMNGDVVIDIALDRSGAMFGTGFHKFISIDPSNAKCQLISEFTDGGYYPNSLTFIPIGALDDTKEALVGYRQFNASDSQALFEDYMRIDPTTGDITAQGNLNQNGPTNGVYFDVSGDLIALSKDNNRAYAVVRPDPTLDAGSLSKTTDYLAEIDPKTGAMKTLIGPTNQWQTYGFGYWAGKGYGFSSDGRITAIDMKTGAATDVLTLDAGGGWYGAGVTTDSPVQ